MIYILQKRRIKNIYLLILLTLLISLIFPSCSHKSNSKVRIPVRYDLIGYKYSFGKPDTSGIIKEKVFFNANGKDSIKILFDESGIQKSKTLFNYDSLGNICQSITYNAFGEVKTKSSYEYDNKGLILSSKEDDADGGYHYQTYYYNNGKLIRKHWQANYNMSSEWTKADEVVYLDYDIKDRLIAERYCDNNKVSYVFYYKNDSLGRQIEMSIQSNTRKYKYDNNGNITEEISLSGDGKQAWRWVRKYNTQKVLIEEITFNSLNEPIELQKKIIYF